MGYSQPPRAGLICLNHAADRNRLFGPPKSHRLRPERTRISCHAALDKAARAAFIKESRMKFTSATKFNRKSGGAEWRDLRFLFGSHTKCPEFGESFLILDNLRYILRYI